MRVTAALVAVFFALATAAPAASACAGGDSGMKGCHCQRTGDTSTCARDCCGHITPGSRDKAPASRGSASSLSAPLPDHSALTLPPVVSIPALPAAQRVLPKSIGPPFIPLRI